MAVWKAVSNFVGVDCATFPVISDIVYIMRFFWNDRKMHSKKRVAIFNCPYLDNSKTWMYDIMILPVIYVHVEKIVTENS